MLNDTVVIEISLSAINQRPFVEHIKTISASMQTFLLAIIDVAKDDDSFSTLNNETDTLVITRKSVQELLKSQGNGSSDSLISVRLGELKDLGVADLTTASLGGRKRLNHYSILHFKDLSKLTEIKQAPPATPSRRTTKEIIHAQRELFKREEGSLLLSDPKDLILFHEQVFNGILDSCMRLSSKDKRKNIAIEFDVAGKPLKISSSCSTKDNSDIAKLSDQRAMRNIISLCKAEITKRKMKLESEHGSDFNPLMIPNMFHIDIHDMCKLMGMTSAANNISNVANMMQRLADTKFTVDASANPWFKNQFSTLYSEEGVQSDYFEFQFLNNLEIAHYNTKIKDLFGGADLTELKPRFYTFTLETRMYLTLISNDSTNLFLSHPGLSTENSGIIQRFYNWARAFISGRNKFKQHETWYSLFDMHDYLTPSVRLDNFRIYFLRALKRFAKDGEWDDKKQQGKALVYGYYVYYKRENGVDLFRIERDKEDPIVGDNSRHNILLRQEEQRQRELIEYEGS